MTDIAPDLLKKIQEEFLKQTKANEKLERILIKIQQGKATYADAAEYATEIGNALAQAFAKHLSPDALPVGKLNPNIAERIIQPLLLEAHTDVATVAAQVQTALNKAANIGIRAQTTSFPDKLVTDMLSKVTSAPSYKDAAWILDEPIKTLMRKVVDITIKKNFEFQGKSGLRPQIIRHSAKQCCEWCAAISGTYTYPDTPQDVFRRHDRCRCVVEYNPKSGKRQNVHTKQWTAAEQEAIERRKKFAETEITRKTPNAKKGD